MSYNASLIIQQNTLKRSPFIQETEKKGSLNGHSVKQIKSGSSGIAGMIAKAVASVARKVLSEIMKPSELSSEDRMYQVAFRPY